LTICIVPMPLNYTTNATIICIEISHLQRIAF
jgi:hypothetical protein